MPLLQKENLNRDFAPALIIVFCLSQVLLFFSDIQVNCEIISAVLFSVGNGPCSQQCSAVNGLARCSCFPGFSLNSDGRTCEGELAIELIQILPAFSKMVSETLHKHAYPENCKLKCHALVQ